MFKPIYIKGLLNMADILTQGKVSKALGPDLFGPPIIVEPKPSDAIIGGIFCFIVAIGFIGSLLLLVLLPQ